jgi:hypothetical protein
MSRQDTLGVDSRASRYAVKGEDPESQEPKQAEAPRRGNNTATNHGLLKATSKDREVY